MGEDHDPVDEAVRFRSHTGFAYQGGEVAAQVGGPGIAAINSPAPDRPAAVYMRRLSLFGSTGALPYEFTEWVTRAGPDGEPLRECADIALHRPLSLAYAASERLRPGAAYERRGGAAGWSKHDPYLAPALRAAGLFQLPAPQYRLAGVMARLAKSPYAGQGSLNAHLHSGLRSCYSWQPRQTQTPVPPRGSSFVGPMGWAEFRQFLPPNREPPDVPLYDLLALSPVRHPPVHRGIAPQPGESYRRPTPGGPPVVSNWRSIQRRLADRYDSVRGVRQF